MKKNKLKLKPSARDKRRYFLFSGKREMAEKAILECIGTFGFSKASYMDVNSNEFSGMNVGSCLREYLDEVRASLLFYGIKVYGVSGTLKGLKEFYRLMR